MKRMSILAAIISCAHFIHADNMNIMNLTSQPASVTLSTASKDFTKSTIPNENLYVQQNLDNQSNQYDNPLANLTYDHGQIKKITINRAQSDVPQIVYYNDEVTSDSNGPTGIYATFIAGKGTLQILQDSIKVNGLTYNANDLNSFKIKCQSLKSKLSAGTKIDDVQKEINDLSQSLRLIDLSDSASTLGLQLSVIKSKVDDLVNTLHIVQQTKDFDKNLQNITKNLTPENVDQVQEKINNMTIALQAIDKTDTQNIIDPNAIKEKMAQLQAQVNTIKDNLKRTSQTMLVNTDSPTI